MSDLIFFSILVLMNAAYTVYATKDIKKYKKCLETQMRKHAAVIECIVSLCTQVAEGIDQNAVQQVKEAFNQEGN